MLAAILPRIRTGVVKCNQCAVYPHRGAGDVVISRPHIISKMNHISSSSSGRNYPVGIGKIRDAISCAGIQQNKMNFYISPDTFNV